MHRLHQLIDDYNTNLWNPVGLNILWPRNVAFMFVSETALSNMCILLSFVVPYS